jgi:hypothetical protein
VVVKLELWSMFELAFLMMLLVLRFTFLALISEADMKRDLKNFLWGLTALSAMCMLCTAVYAGNAVPVLSNPGFESPNQGAPAHGEGVGDNWDWVGLSGSDWGDPYGIGTNSTPSTGYQMAFIQGSGDSSVCSFSQTLTGLTVGTEYNLSFQAKGIDSAPNGFDTNPFQVSLNGSPLSFSGNTNIAPPVSSSYTMYSTTFTATAPTATLAFADLGSPVVTNVSWIDDIRLSFANPGTNLVANGSFESPGYVDGDHMTAPTGTGWTFSVASSTVGSGIDRGNAYGSENSGPFNGDQHAFIQGAVFNGAGDGEINSIEQEITTFEVGKQYRLSFEAEALIGAGDIYQVNPLSVSVGGELISFGGAGNTTVRPSAAYEFYVSDIFTATSDTMTLRFFDTGAESGFHVTLLDNVAISEVPEPATIVSLIVAAAIGGLGLLRRRMK